MMKSAKSVKTARVTRICKYIGLLLAVTAAACGLLIYPSAASDGGLRGIGYCLDILIPSLFPFMVLATFLVKSGLSDKIGRVIEPVTRFLFRLPGCAGATILMSMIGGYPVGARGIAALYDNGSITENEAKRMLCFCVNAGPAFVISVVGSAMLGSTEAGVVLFCAQISASLIMGIFCGWTAKKEEKPAKRPYARAANGSALISSASDASRGMASMCTFVILFAVLLSLLRTCGFAQAFCGILLRLGFAPPASASLLSVLLEVTGGCYDAVSLGASCALVSFAIGWGGICVHFQVLASVTKIRISRLRFTLFRLLHGFIASIIAGIFMPAMPLTAEVFSNIAAPLRPAFSASAPAAGALMVLCAAFLLSVPNESDLHLPKLFKNRAKVK